MRKIIVLFLSFNFLIMMVSSQSSPLKYSDSVKVNNVYTWKVNSARSDFYKADTNLTVKILKDFSSLSMDIDDDLLYDPGYSYYSCTNDGENDYCDLSDFIIPVKMSDGSSYYTYLDSQDKDSTIGGFRFVKDFSINSGQLTFVYSGYNSQDELLYRTTKIFDANGIMTSLTHSSGSSYTITGYEVDSPKSETPVVSFVNVFAFLTIFTVFVRWAKKRHL